MDFSERREKSTTYEWGTDVNLKQCLLRKRFSTEVNQTFYH